MAKRIGKREAYREAVNMAASMVEDADFYSLFGDLADDTSDEDEQVLHDAQKKCVDRIRSLIKAQP